MLMLCPLLKLRRIKYDPHVQGRLVSANITTATQRHRLACIYIARLGLYAYTIRLVPPNTATRNNWIACTDCWIRAVHVNQQAIKEPRYIGCVLQSPILFPCTTKNDFGWEWPLHRHFNPLIHHNNSWGLSGSLNTLLSVRNTHNYLPTWLLNSDIRTG